MCVWVGVYRHLYLVLTSQKRVLGHLGLKSQTVVSCLVNSGKNPWAVSPALRTVFKWLRTVYGFSLLWDFGFRIHGLIYFITPHIWLLECVYVCVCVVDSILRETQITSWILEVSYPHNNLPSFLRMNWRSLVQSSTCSSFSLCPQCSSSACSHCLATIAG